MRHKHTQFPCSHDISLGLENGGFDMARVGGRGLTAAFPPTSVSVGLYNRCLAGIVDRNHERGSPVEIVGPERAVTGFRIGLKRRPGSGLDDSFLSCLSC